MHADYLPISYLNDFIFCPRSIYNHQLYSNFDETLYNDIPQKVGKNTHAALDSKTYSDRQEILQNHEVYSDKYQLFGKIDQFNTRTGVLTERKSNITTIYDGYIFQLYAQCFGLREGGFAVNKLELYDYAHNKKYPVALPEDDPCRLQAFEDLLERIDDFSLLEEGFVANPRKCARCIYRLLCDAAAVC